LARDRCKPAIKIAQTEERKGCLNLPAPALDAPAGCGACLRCRSIAFMSWEKAGGSSGLQRLLIARTMKQSFVRQSSALMDMRLRSGNSLAISSDSSRVTIEDRCHFTGYRDPPPRSRHPRLGEKTPKIFPVSSIERKLSGSCPGWRVATSCARSLAAAIASAALVKTEVSFSTGMPPLSQTIANNSDSCPHPEPRRRFALLPGERRTTKPLGAALALKAAGTALNHRPEAFK
jgi:hypothetical protein